LSENLTERKITSCGGNQMSKKNRTCGDRRVIKLIFIPIQQQKNARGKGEYKVRESRRDQSSHVGEKRT